jgi:hypothetical protein
MVLIRIGARRCRSPAQESVLQAAVQLNSDGVHAARGDGPAKLKSGSAALKRWIPDAQAV